MKKEYVKPALYVESFALSANIARGCAVTNWSTNHQDANTCAAIIVGQRLFLSTPTCEYPPETEEEFESMRGVCYQTITDSNRLFNS